jgi:hypothetical protein
LAAIRICRLALEASGKDEEPDLRDKLQAARERLGVSKADSMTVSANAYKPLASGGIELSEMRAVQIPFQGELHGEFKSATFAVVIENGKKIRQALFLEGAEELRPATKAFAATSYRQTFPDDTPAKLALKGLLSCSKYSKGCTFVFMPLDSLGATFAPNQ